MRKICFAFVSGVFALTATSAFASTIYAGPFKTYGECRAWLPWQNENQEKASAHFDSSSREALDYHLRCEQVSGKWYAVYG